MDGVLCDFNARAQEVHGCLHLKLTNWEWHKDIGLTIEEFWEKIDNTPGFWESLAPFPWMAELVQLIEDQCEFTLLTAPSWHPSSYAGKRKWIQQYFGESFTACMLGTRKYLLARPDAILIDDSNKNCAKFVKHGGSAILFPQPWNSNNVYATSIESRMNFVKSRLLSELAGV